MIFTVVIIDDEPYALKDFETTLKLVLGIEVIGAFPSVPSALSFLRSHGRVNFIFSDIKMPGFSGIEGGKLMAEFCDLLVYTTGFPGYSLHAFEVGAKGYLIKPVSVEEVLKLMNDLSKIKNLASMSKYQFPDFIEVKDAKNSKPCRVLIKDILFISTCANYVEVHTEEQIFLKYSTMKEIEKTLRPYGDFSRINQSTIIALGTVLSATKDGVTLRNGKTFSISRSRKNAFFQIYNDIAIEKIEQ